MKEKTAVIVLHEIYGVNSHMKHMCQKLVDKQLEVLCPSLIGEERVFSYEQQKEAYAYFTERIGFARAAFHVKQLIARLKKEYKAIFLVGFSAGATVAWLCSEEKGLGGIVGYYGSRIRDYLQVSPSCPVLLFFPETELSFHVEDVLNSMKKPGIRTVQWPARHGFSDPFSVHYNHTAAEGAFREAIEWIKGERVNGEVYRAWK
ncbi:dienelactone hydrolase family protein [Domibacillus indicus]|uniref:dienelactone hydrolase family protein n=1 Tax=Domibacillus indicus TaxID=1437523 RepID=UPI0006183121|nr:dienelactone hydrolase family protein [Domibacillus indicus]